MGRVIGKQGGDVDPEAPTERINAGGRRWSGGANRADESPDATSRHGSANAGRSSYDAYADDDDEKTQRVRKKRKDPESVEDEELFDDEERPLPAGFLVIVKGPGLGHVALIETGVNILGRGPEAQIVLDFGDVQISRKDHVRFSYNRKSRQFRILPGSGPETWHGGELVDEARTLKRGDLITIGETVLRFIPFCDESFDWSEDEQA